MSEQNDKMVVLCNGNQASNIMPTLIMSSSGVALDKEVIIFFCPAGAPLLVKGELEKFKGLKGLPDPVELFDTILDQGVRVIFCVLAHENKGIKKEDLRDERIEIMNATSFLMDAEGADISLVF
jgi:predicted peroxiredoxin